MPASPGSQYGTAFNREIGDVGHANLACATDCRAALDGMIAAARGPVDDERAAADRRRAGVGARARELEYGRALISERDILVIALPAAGPPMRRNKSSLSLE